MHDVLSCTACWFISYKGPSNDDDDDDDDDDNNNNNNNNNNDIPGKHEVKELQTTAILSTAHIVRKVLI